ncbi:MAG TPA: hypothetical protein VEC11_08475 [Allosphingosinicella sp.]|nr:hypothetical protein [Allosphingosinicella sp.]
MNDPEDGDGAEPEQAPLGKQFKLPVRSTRPMQPPHLTYAGPDQDGSAEADAAAGPEEGVRGGPPHGEGVGGGGGSTVPPPNHLDGDAIKHFAGKRIFKVGLIGFPGGGKTFFLNRLKYSYANFQIEDDRRFYIDPPHDEEPVGQTTWPTYHQFTRMSQEEWETKALEGLDDGSERDFVLFDLPGERFKSAVTGRMRGNMADAIAACDALILVLPAELVFGSAEPIDEIIIHQLAAAEDELDNLPGNASGSDQANPGETSRSRKERRLADLEARRKRDEVEERREALQALIADLEQRLELPEAARDGADVLAEARAQLNRFVSNIDTLVARVGPLRRLGITSEEFDSMSDDEQKAAIRGTATRTYAPLIYVAISKADEVFSDASPIVPLRAELDGHPRDILDDVPTEALSVCQPGIFKGISSTFDWYRFDFVTSFEGQSRKCYGAISTADVIKGEKIKYDDVPHYGVSGVIDWLEFAKRNVAAIKKTGFARFVAFFRGSAPKWELAAAREAALQVAEEKGFGLTQPRRSLMARLYRRMLKMQPKAAKKFVGGLLAILALFTVYSTGVAEATWVWWNGGAGGYDLTPQPRYPVEVARLRAANQRFATGFLIADVRPWSEVPLAGEMFTVAPTRRVRPRFTTILAELQAQPATISRDVGEAFIGRLNRLQAEMNTEYAATDENGVHRERAFISYHIGLVQLRMGDFGGAATSFGSVLSLLEREAPPRTRLGEGRMLGVIIATRYARGIAYLGGQNTSAAIADFDVALGMLPSLGDQPASGGRQGTTGSNSRRILLTSNQTGGFFDFETLRTPASLNTASLWADALAAHIRGFDAARDLGPSSDLSRLMNRLGRIKNDIPRDHPLAANYMITGALLGRPLSEVRMAAVFTDTEHRNVAEAALRAIGRPSVGGSDVWTADRQIRAAFARGDVRAVDETLARWDTSQRAPASDQEFLRQLADEIVSTERQALPRSERESLLQAYGKYLRGSDFLALANDLAVLGGSVLALLFSLLLLAVIWRFHVFYKRSWETLQKFVQPQHGRDRKATEIAT